MYQFFSSKCSEKCRAANSCSCSYWIRTSYIKGVNFIAAMALKSSDSELNFHIWNVNFQSFARAKSEAKMAAQGVKFCTSFPVPCSTLIFSFCLVQLPKHSQPWKKCSDEILLDQYYINEYLKVFIIAVWPKMFAKLSEGGKLTVKSGRTFTSFLK